MEKATDLKLDAKLQSAQDESSAASETVQQTLDRVQKELLDAKAKATTSAQAAQSAEDKEGKLQAQVTAAEAAAAGSNDGAGDATVRMQSALLEAAQKDKAEAQSRATKDAEAAMILQSKLDTEQAKLNDIKSDADAAVNRVAAQVRQEKASTASDVKQAEVLANAKKKIAATK